MDVMRTELKTLSLNSTFNDVINLLNNSLLNSFPLIDGMSTFSYINEIVAETTSQRMAFSWDQFLETVSKNCSKTIILTGSAARTMIHW